MTDYIGLIDQYREQMIETLRELIAIPSVGGAAEGDMPFGQNVQEALEYMLAKGQADGFEVENIDNYGGHIDFGGEIYDQQGALAELSGETMGILSHLDVVPEGSGWDYPPFGGEVADGKLYGRGAIDDKGPTIAAYYAMKAIKDSGLMPEKKVRLILGLDEETGWKGMEYYFKKVKAPDFGFTPDAEFPAIHGEMGLLIFELAKKIGKSVNKGVVLRRISGGNAANMVPDFAKALIRADSYEEIKAKLTAFRQETGYQIKATGRGKSMEISCVGQSAHGAQPWKGQNAISILMMFLEQVGVVNEDAADFIDFYNRHLGFETDGSSLGCGFSDRLSGKLILNVGMIEMDEEVARLTINIRYPITMNDQQIFDGMLEAVNHYDLGIVKLEHRAPIYFEPDDPMITTLMEVYRKYTGDQDSKPIVIGGGTYARSAKNIVAFGMMYPGEPEVEHQKNEYVSVDNLVRSAKIFAEAICRLTDAKPIPEKEEGVRGDGLEE